MTLLKRLILLLAGISLLAQPSAAQVSSWSSTATSNVTVGGVNIREGMQVGLVNNAIRAVMADAKTKFDVVDQQIIGRGETDYLGKVSADLYAGTAVAAIAFGDSTFWGADPANLSNQVTIPSPAALQNIVNLYYGNSALSVGNSAISGTTATQMIAGTDGSGSTFAAKMAASSARVVYCNHGVNDAYGPNATTADAYKVALVSFVETARKYGKAPILVTPFWVATYGTFGSPDRAEKTRQFAQVMRDVAQQFSVPLVDNNRFLEQMLAGGKYTPLGLLPDGVHASAATYIRMGYNLAIPIIAQIRSFTQAGQFSVAASGGVLATNQIVNADTASRFGAVVTSGTTGAVTMRAVVLVAEPKLDLAMIHPIWSSGSPTFTLQMDGATIFSGFSEYSAAYSSDLIQDYETTIAENIDPGLHIVHMSASNGAFGLYGFRSRPARYASALTISGSTLPALRRSIAPRLDVESTVADTNFIAEDLPSPRLLRTVEYEFTSQLQTTSGLTVGSYRKGPNAGSAAARQGIIVGLNGAGFLTVYESSGPSSFTSTTLGGSDLSGASHIYREVITPTGGGGFGTIAVYVDGAQVGSTTNLTQPYWGGNFGVWKNNAGGVVTITNLYEVIRQ